MVNKDDDDTVFDTVCKEAYNEKIAEPLTWSNIRSRLKWRNVFLLTFFHAGFIASVIMYTFGLHSVPIKWATIIWGELFVIFEKIVNRIYCKSNRVVKKILFF